MHLDEWTKMDYSKSGIALDPNCGVYRRVPARDRIGSFLLFLLRPNLHVHLSMRKHLTILIV